MKVALKIMAPAGTDMERPLLTLIEHVENDVVYVIAVATAITQRLEDPRYLDELAPVLEDEALTVLRDLNAKDINRFSTIKQLVEILYPVYTAGQELKGFDYWRKWMVEAGLLSKQKEHGGGWQGFGGVHSHYYLSRLGRLFFNFQSFFMLDPPVDFGICVEEGRVEFYRVVERVVREARVVKPYYPLHRSTKPTAVKKTAALLMGLLEESLPGKKVKHEAVLDRAGHLFGKPIRVEHLNELIQRFIALFEPSAKSIEWSEDGRDLVYLYGQLSRFIYTGEF